MTKPITLTSGQSRAMDNLTAFLRKPGFGVRVLKGHAGTGKTTAIHLVYSAYPRLKWAFTAPTNKATKVLKAMAGSVPANVIHATIYSLLGLTLAPSGEVKALRQNEFREPEFCSCDVVVIDEASMLNDDMTRRVVSTARKYGIKVIFMGDPLQLPPVGYAASPVFTEGFPTLELTEQCRFGDVIGDLVEHIRRCITEAETLNLTSAKAKTGGVYVLTPEKWLHWVKVGFNADRYMEVDNSFRAIAWRNKTVADLNRTIRKVLYPAQWTELFVEGERVLAGAPVMDGPDGDIVMTTDEEAVIESLQVIQHPVYPQFEVYGLNLLTSEGGHCTACCVHPESYGKFNSELDRRARIAKQKPGMWGSFWSFKEQFADIRPCHAITAHRSQGSTYENAFIDAGDILLNQNRREALQCLYVAVSRASQNVMIRM